MLKRGLMVLSLVILVGVVAAFFWLRGSLDGLVRDAIEKYGSEMTQARVQVASVEIKPTDGAGEIRGLVIANPAGFKTPHAFTADRIEVAVDLGTLAKDVVVIKKIAVLAPLVVYEKADSQTNFDAIQKNIAQSLGPSKQTSGGKKLIVEEFTVRGARAEASAPFLAGKTVAVNLPDIVLRDIGKAKGGVTPGELGQEISRAITQKLVPAISFDKMVKSVGDGLDKAGEAIKGLFK